jgi:hypothetical protein
MVRANRRWSRRSSASWSRVEGSIDMPRRARLGYIAQEAPSGQTTLFDSVLSSG